MADEHHRHSALFKVAHDLKQPHNFTLRECCRWFVHDQHASILRQRPSNLDELLLGGAQHAKSRVGIDGETNRSKKSRCFASHGGPIDDARRQSRHMSHEYVLGDREVGKETWMLVHYRDAGALCVKGSAEDDRLFVQHHVA